MTRSAQAQIALAPMSAAEVRRWQQLDPMVRRSEKDSFEADEFLFEISEGKLFRAGFKSFDAYLETLGIPRSSGWARVAVGKVMHHARASGAYWLPKNRHQATQLAGLEQDVIFRVLELAGQREKDGKRSPTAEQLAGIVEEATGRPPGALPGEVSEEVAAAVAAEELAEEELMDLMASGAPPAEEQEGKEKQAEEPAPRPTIPPGNTKLHRQAKWLGSHLDSLRREAEKEGDWLVRMVERWQDALARAIVKKLQKANEQRAA